MTTPPANAPWAPKPPLPIPYAAEVVSFDDAAWSSFEAYYLKRRGASDESTSRILSQLPTLSPATKQALLDDSRKTHTDKDLTGQLGEILGSYVLEAHHGVLLFGLTWPIQPFEVRRGTDISGVCTECWLVIFGESKASSTQTSVKSQILKARDGLKARRLAARFGLKQDDGQSRRSAVRAIRRALKNGELKNATITSKEVEQLVSVDMYARVGLIIHETGCLRLDKALKDLEQDDLAHQKATANSKAEREQARRIPTVFFDVSVGSFENAKERWLGLDTCFGEDDEP